MNREGIVRCDWGSAEHNMIEYHDKVWGVSAHDDRKLFEFITLERA